MSLRNRTRAGRGERYREERRVEPVRELPQWADGNREALSGVMRKKFVELADRFAQYEEFARSATTPEERVIVFEILEKIGVINKELVDWISRMGECMNDEADRKKDRYFQYKKIRNGEGYETVMTVDHAGIAASIGMTDSALYSLLRGNEYQNGSNLYQEFGMEILKQAYIFSLFSTIERHKKLHQNFNVACASVIPEFVRNIDNTRGDSQQKIIVFWFRLLFDLLEKKERIVRVKWEEGMSEQLALEKLKNITFEKQESIQIPIDGIKVGGNSFECVIRASADASMYAVCELMLRLNGTAVVGYLSRITGDVTFTGSKTASVERLFKYFKKNELYLALREAVIAGVYQLWKDDQLKEKVEVGIVENDEEEEGREDRQEIQQEQKVAQTSYDRMSKDEVERIVSTFTGAIRVDGRRERRRAEGELSGYSWRRVLEAFRRCGVTVVMVGDHPKLKFRGKTVDYINQHSGGNDPRRNREVVNDTLKKLGIKREEFIRNL